ncbi:hypothetical protein E5676_scaffold2030G00280 [Cucumis melo var. makuwa]|uniref:Uncharacterized protein n=1 Tax=Cucumis melo var. makuwa TaxID=1194695 RepID=A0A5D3DYE2_CUCMM|nr:hypothetical protein E5676_scaffold2030G00280 [Cucumis melo var. makuwa]
MKTKITSKFPSTRKGVGRYKFDGQVSSSEIVVREENKKVVLNLLKGRQRLHEEEEKNNEAEKMKRAFGWKKFCVGESKVKLDVINKYNDTEYHPTNLYATIEGEKIYFNAEMINELRHHIMGHAPLNGGLKGCQAIFLHDGESLLEALLFPHHATAKKGFKCVASETSSSPSKERDLKESFRESEGKDIYDFIGSTVAKRTFDYFEQVLYEQTINSMKHDAMTTLMEKVQVENSKLKQLLTEQQKQVAKIMANQDQLSSTVSNLTCVVIMNFEMTWKMGVQRDKQFKASIEYTHAVFAQRMPSPFISPEIESLYPLIQPVNLGYPDPHQDN